MKLPSFKKIHISDIPALVRRLLLSWLVAVTVEYALLPCSLRDLSDTTGLVQMSILRILILSAFGTVNFTVAYSCLLAFFLLGAALIAICMFLSSLADSQIVAAILGFAAVLVIYMAESIASMIPETAAVSLFCLIALSLIVGIVGYFLTKSAPVACGIGGLLSGVSLILFFLNRTLFEGLFPAILSQMALFDRFGIFSYGLLDLPALILYLSVSVFFVTLTVLGAEKKRWA